MTGAKKTVATIIPSLRYRDAPAAIEWLCRAFGFEKHAVYADGATTGGGAGRLGTCSASSRRSIRANTSAREKGFFMKSSAPMRWA